MKVSNINRSLFIGGPHDWKLLEIESFGKPEVIVDDNGFTPENEEYFKNSAPWVHKYVRHMISIPVYVFVHEKTTKKELLDAIFNRIQLDPEFVWRSMLLHQFSEETK